MRKCFLLSTVIISCLLVSCADLEIGKPIPFKFTQLIRPGFTTKDEIITKLGAPLHNVPGEDGEIWVYRYLDGEKTVQELVISFKEDKVSLFSYH